MFGTQWESDKTIKQKRLKQVEKMQSTANHYKSPQTYIIETEGMDNT
jgi:hypothetical protein